MSNDTRTYALSTKTLLQIVLIGALICGLFIVRDIVMVILVSIVLSSFIEGIVKKCHRFHMPRALTVTLVYVVCFAVLAGIIILFVPLVIQEVSSLSDLINTYLPRTTELGGIARGTLFDTKTIINYFSGDISFSQFLKSFESMFGGIGGVFNGATNIFSIILNTIFLLVITFYLSIQDKGVDNFLRIITPATYEDQVITIWERTERKIGLWMSGQFILGLIIGGIIFIGLTLLNVQYALLIALLAMVSELIPYGFLFAALFGLMIIFADAGVGIGLRSLLLFGVTQTVEVYFLAPLIVRRIVGVSPLVMILSLFIGGELAGFWGILLAIPTAILFIEIINAHKKV